MELGKIWKWGTRKGRRRYRCNACTRSFDDFTGTPLAHIKKPWRWFARCIECVLEGKTVRECAEEAGVSVPTAWRWRHVVLRTLRQLEEGVGRERLIEVERLKSDPTEGVGD